MYASILPAAFEGAHINLPAAFEGAHMNLLIYQ